MKGPHGMPPDLLDRTLIISTTPYTSDEIQRIFQIRLLPTHYTHGRVIIDGSSNEFLSFS